jgi:hypothetical protein
MKKLLVPFLVVALVAVAVPVFAFTMGGYDQYQQQECNVSLDGKVDFDKTVKIHQTRDDYYKTFIFTCFKPAARADSEAVKNDLNKENYLEIGAATLKDDVCSSFTSFNGIGQNNLSAGSMNNQGNVVSVAAVGSAKAYASSLAAVGVTNTKNEISITYEAVVPDGNTWSFFPGYHDDSVLKQTDSLKYSFNHFNGIGQNNMSAGSLNNQNNVVSVAAGIVVYPYVGGRDFGDLCKDAVAVSGAELAMNNTHNRLCFDKAEFTNSVTSSFNNFNGIGQNNLSAGNMNNQVNVVSVAASVKVNP